MSPASCSSILQVYVLSHPYFVAALGRTHQLRLVAPIRPALDRDVAQADQTVGVLAVQADEDVAASVAKQAGLVRIAVHRRLSHYN